MSARRIASVDGWEVLDSRGRPTVACAVRLEGGASGLAAVPSGASTGSHEVHERRDGDERYGGAGVRGAVEAVRGPLASAVQGMDAAEQVETDASLRAADGTSDLHLLGGNAVLAVSVAVCLAAADQQGVPLHRWVATGPALLPLPMVNIVSGGAHAAGAVDVQDVLAVPVGARGFSEALEWAARVRAGTVEAARGRGHATALVADEGGLAFPLASNRQALEVVLEGVERAGLTPGDDVGIGLDVAATQLYDPATGRYVLQADRRELEPRELVAELLDWTRAFPIISVEDPLTDDDWDGWAELTSHLGARVQVLGDDLLATSPARLETAIARGAANAVLVKPNQVGTLSDAARVVATGRAASYGTVVSARSGDTEDAWLADLAVGWGAGQIKVGSTMRSERTAKWNRLLRIEHELGDEGSYAGGTALPVRSRREATRDE